MHTCHISHCEIKSHRIWPIWKAIPIRFFKSHRIFRPSYILFYEEININRTFFVFITSFLHLNKGFWPFWGAPKWFLWKSHIIYHISLKNLPYLTDTSPELMACMRMITAISTGVQIFLIFMVYCKHPPIWVWCLPRFHFVMDEEPFWLSSFDAKLWANLTSSWEQHLNIPKVGARGANVALKLENSISKSCSFSPEVSLHPCSRILASQI